MSADYQTEHFKGYQHDGYISIFHYGIDGEWMVGNFTKNEIDEISSMFDDEVLTDEQ